MAGVLAPGHACSPRRGHQAVIDGVLALPLKEGYGEAWSDAELGLPRWFVCWREDPLHEALVRAGWTVLRLEHVQGRFEPWLRVRLPWQRPLR